MSGKETRFDRTERWVLTAAGGWLTARGWRRRSRLGGALCFFGGVALVMWAQRRVGAAAQIAFDCAGHRARYGAGVTSGIFDQAAQAAKEERHPAGTFIEDVVAEASDDSFPCSDPPGWTSRCEMRPADEMKP